MSDIDEPNLWKLLDRRDSMYGGDQGSMDFGVRSVIERMTVVEIIDARLAAIDDAIGKQDQIIEGADRDARSAGLRKGNAIRQRGQLQALAHRVRQQRKAVADV